jgi:hypothetical protein
VVPVKDIVNLVPARIGLRAMLWWEAGVNGKRCSFCFIYFTGVVISPLFNFLSSSFHVQATTRTSTLRRSTLPTWDASSGQTRMLTCAMRQFYFYFFSALISFSFRFSFISERLPCWCISEPLLPNWTWLPVGYHGRASSVVVSGMEIIIFVVEVFCYCCCCCC